MTSTSSINPPNLAETVTTTPIPNPASRHTPHTLPPPFHLSQPQPTLLTQGAEALVYKTTFLEHTPAALKYRPSKPYRHPTLDARLTKSRVLAEARVLVKLSGLRAEGVNAPAVFGVEWDVGRKGKGSDGGVITTITTTGSVTVAGQGQGAWILMEWIEGRSVKDLLRDWDAWYQKYGKEQGEEKVTEAQEQVKALMRRVGRAVAAMHSKAGVIHGDLTSSNIMIRPVGGTTVGGGEVVDGSGTPPDLEGEIVLIDFGLTTQSVQEEDRAVDLYVLERAFGSTHPRQEAWFDAEVLQGRDGYRGAFKGAHGILKRLEEVRMRGRKRTMIG